MHRHKLAKKENKMSPTCFLLCNSVSLSFPTKGRLQDGELCMFLLTLQSEEKSVLLWQKNKILQDVL